MKRSLVLTSIMLFTLGSIALAIDYQPAGDEWITKWYSLDLVTTTGGFNASAAHDWLAEGTGDKITQEDVSTIKGLQKLLQVDTVNLPDHGAFSNPKGELKWSVVTIDPNDGNNMSSSHGQADLSDIEWYGIIVIESPNDRTTTMHPAHDDYAHIWLNGEKVYDNPNWTGGVTIVTTPTEVNLNKGENVLLFRCGESGGSDYINLHFENSDGDLKILPTMDDKFWRYIKSLSVEPTGKLAITWADIKR